jgi:hypothetical protein
MSQGQFGLDRVADLRGSRGPAAGRVLRLLTKAVTDYRSGPLADDASAVCLD